MDFENSEILQFLGMKSEFNHSANHLNKKFMTFGRKNTSTSMMIGIEKEVLTIEIFTIVLIKRNVKIITN